MISHISFVDLKTKKSNSTSDRHCGGISSLKKRLAYWENVLLRSKLEILVRIASNFEKMISLTLTLPS